MFRGKLVCKPFIPRLIFRRRSAPSDQSQCADMAWTFKLASAQRDRDSLMEMSSGNEEHRR